jgi:hypothetical protein
MLEEYLPGLAILAIIWTVCGVIGWREMHRHKKKA